MPLCPGGIGGPDHLTLQDLIGAAHDARHSQGGAGMEGSGRVTFPLEDLLGDCGGTGGVGVGMRDFSYPRSRMEIYLPFHRDFEGVLNW